MNQTRGRQLSGRERVLALLGIAGVVALLVLLYQPTGPRSRFRDLSEQSSVSHEFAQTRISKNDASLPNLGESNAEPGGAKQEAAPSSDWPKQLAIYEGGRFEDFIQAIDLAGPEPGPRKLLYLGSAQLLTGRLTDAIQSLRRVLPAPDSLLVAEARWQLAQAYLAAEEPDPARDELNYLIDQKTHRALDAKQKLAVLESRLPAR